MLTIHSARALIAPGISSAQHVPPPLYFHDSVIPMPKASLPNAVLSNLPVSEALRYTMMLP
jgi:hypothetical protein